MATLPFVAASYIPGAVGTGSFNQSRFVYLAPVSAPGAEVGVLRRVTNSGTLQTYYGAGTKIFRVGAYLLDLLQQEFYVYGVTSSGAVVGATRFSPELGAGEIAIPEDTGTVVFAGTPRDDLDLLLQCTVGGAMGVAEHRVSLDGGYTFQAAVVSSVGSRPILDMNGADTGCVYTLDADDGDFGAGHVFRARASAPRSSVNDLKIALQYLATQDKYKFGIVLPGQTFSEADTATALEQFSMAAVSGEDYGNLFSVPVPFRGINLDETVDEWVEAGAAVVDPGHYRVMKLFGEFQVFDSTSRIKPFVDAGVVFLEKLLRAGPRRELMQQSMGPLSQILQCRYAETGDGYLYGERWVVARRWSGLEGYYAAAGLLATAPNERLKYFYQQQLMDLVLYALLVRAPQCIGKIAITQDGQLVERSAQQWSKFLRDGTVNLIDGEWLQSVSVDLSNSTVSEDGTTLVVDYSCKIGGVITAVILRGSVTVS